MFKTSFNVNYEKNTIDVSISVELKDYLGDVYIKEVLIDNIDTLSEDGQPSNEAKKISIKENYGSQKDIILSIDIDTKSKPLFLYVVPTTVPANAPCEDKKSYEYIGYTFYKKDIYDMFMKLLNKKNPCEFPTFIATKYLKYVAVDMAVKNKDFSLFKQLYNDLYTDIIKL